MAALERFADFLKERLRIGSFPDEGVRLELALVVGRVPRLLGSQHDDGDPVGGGMRSQSA